MTIPLLLLFPLAASGSTALAKGRRTMEIIHLLSALAAFGTTILLAADVLDRVVPERCVVEDLAPEGDDLVLISVGVRANLQDHDARAPLPSSGLVASSTLA